MWTQRVECDWVTEQQQWLIMMNVFSCTYLSVIYLMMNCLFKCIAYFLLFYWMFVTSFLSLENSFYIQNIFSINPLSNMWLPTIFSLLIYNLSISFTVSFQETQVIIIVFLHINYDFGAITKQTPQVTKIFLIIFLLEVL